MTAELQAVELAASTIYDAGFNCHQAVIITDAIALLQVLESGKLPHQRSTEQNSCQKRIIPQWVSSLCCVLIVKRVILQQVSSLCCVLVVKRLIPQLKTAFHNLKTIL